VAATLHDVNAFARQQSQTRQTHLHIVAAADFNHPI
jgi:hypothetical protein